MNKQITVSAISDGPAAVRTKEREFSGDDIADACPQDLYYLAPEPLDLNGLYIQINRAGIVLRTPPRFLVSHDDNYRYNQISCVFRGKGSVSSRGMTQEVHSGQAFVLCSNEAHMYSSDPADPMGLVWIEYCGGNSAQLTSHILDLGGAIYGGGVFDDLINLCTAILYQPTQDGPGISLKLYEILMRLCAHVEVSSDAHLEVNAQILKYIDRNIGRRLTLTEVAGAFGYHPAYFSSLFSRMMGVTFSRYVSQRKISHACYLLETTDWSVERIARELSFCDISHFIHRFRSLKGVTPMAYRSGSTLCQNQRERRQDP